jgi:hypothetical protein
MAMLCARCQLTESEAARRLDLNPQTWFKWKSLHSRSEKFGGLIEKFRSERITKLIERVEKSAEGIDVKFPDFRAAMALLGIIDRKRFGPQAEAAPPPQTRNTLTDATMTKILAMLRASNAKPAASVTAGPPVALIGESSVPEPELKNITPGGNP